MPDEQNYVADLYDFDQAMTLLEGSDDLLRILHYANCLYKDNVELWKEIDKKSDSEDNNQS